MPFFDSPAGWCARQTLPWVDGVSVGAQANPGEPQSASAVQRHRPQGSAACSRAQVVVPGQSCVVSQRTPGCTGSSAGQAPPQLALELITSSARKSPSTSATIGFSYQVQEVRYAENSTS